MSQDQAKHQLQQGIAAARDGRTDAARELLQQAVRLDPKNETAWLWLSSVVTTDRERVFCLKQLLAINPENEFAHKGLRALGVEAAALREAPDTSIPILSEDRYTRIQPALDEFLYTYTALPPDPSGIEWTHKTRRRYGETSAQRLRQVTLVAAAIVLLALVGGGALLVQSSGLLEDDDAQSVVYRAPVTVTPTPTATTTPGWGPTPTPFPRVLAVGATSIPTQLAPAGSIYGLATPTAIYPEFDSSVQRRIEPAINLYSIGRYADALVELEAAHESYEPQCYPALIYYEAMSYAEQGGTANLNAAARLLENALAYEPPGERYRGEGYDSCPDAPLLLAALADVRLRQGRTGDAERLSAQAVEGDPDLALAGLVQAHVEQEQGDLDAAAQTLDDALANNPRDTSLLVEAGEVALARGQLNAALDYAGRALYVDPLLQPALRLQSAAYLALAEAAPAGSRPREEYTGLAAHSAQMLLRYFPGDPVGYLSLAQARIEEANYEQAEAALNQIVMVDDPAYRERYESTLAEALQTRGALYARQGRIEAAHNDLQGAAERGEQSLSKPAAEQLLALDLALARYDDAERQLNALLSGEGRSDPELRLLQARLWVEVCRRSALDDLDCNYTRASQTLSDDFIADLSGEQQAAAYAYRAQAAYWQAQARNAPATIARPAYEGALADVEQAMALRDTASDHLYRGLILAALGRYDAALTELTWIETWREVYDYAFLPEDFDERLAAVAAQVAGDAEPEADEAPAAETPAAETPTPTERATEEAAPTESPSPTQAPGATATPLSPEDRPQLP